MKTALYDLHCALNAKFIDFCGWNMPLQYTGIIQEHKAVRSGIGLFDVSHMGRIRIEGQDAELLMDYLSTNRIAGKPDGSAIYTVWCRQDGTAVDDLIVYKESPETFFVIVNACNRQKDLLHLQTYAAGRKVTITDYFQTDGILSLQGPKAADLLGRLFPSIKSLKHMHFISLPSEHVTISRTGYTGEDGFEIYGKNDLIIKLWQWLLEYGKEFGIIAAGLGARDTLRLEAGFALYGHELSDSIAPIESVSAWTIKWDKADFLGKPALEKLKETGHRHEYGIILRDKGIAREGYPIFKEGKQIGTVTSGTFSPTLSKAVAIVLVERNLALGDSLEVQVRGNRCAAQVVALPFYRSNKL